MIDDPVRLLEVHARAVADALPPPSIDLTALADQITAAPPRRHSRRWRPLVAGVGAVVVLGTGAAVAAVVLSEHVSQPGLLSCRAAAERNASAVIVPMSDDPVGACAALWENGTLPDIDHPGPGGARPDLIACVGPQRAMDVYPVFADDVTCESFGLTAADVEAATNDPLLELQERVYEINIACISVADARRQAPELLEELGFDDWTVSEVERDDQCGRLSVDPATRQLVIFPSPLHPGG